MSKLPMWKKSLQTFAIGITIAAGMSLSACNGDKSSTVEEVTSTISADAPESGESKIAKSESSTAESDLDGAVTEGTPVKYDLSTWSEDSVEPIDIAELDSVQSTFGKVIATDKKSLDYASNPATKYRFMSTEAPYLDVIDSQKYLEVGWYFANPKDSDEEKELSKEHAQKAYKLARQVMGDEGSKVLSDMLNGQIIKNQSAGGQKIELAKCEFYSCMIVFNKSGATVAS